MAIAAPLSAVIILNEPSFAFPVPMNHKAWHNADVDIEIIKVPLPMNPNPAISGLELNHVSLLEENRASDSYAYERTVRDARPSDGDA